MFFDFITSILFIEARVWIDKYLSNSFNCSMFLPQPLTDEIVEILRNELFFWIRDGIFRTHADFIKNLTRFANSCLQETHPELYLSGLMIEDPEMEDFLHELKEFVNEGGFLGRY